MDLADHAREVLHAEVQAGSLSEKAVVKSFFMGLRVLGSVTDAGAVLLLSVAAPHHIDGFFASKEVVCVLHQHGGVANIHADRVVLALAMTVSQKTDLCRIRDNALNINTNFVLRTLLLLEIELVVS